jgi:formamidopyrimidine-DNA glycosylase
VPELPEVEVTRQKLEPLLLGRRIERVFTSVPSYFFLTPPAVLRRRLRGRRFQALERVGKYLVARLDNRERLLLHLGMTGQIFGAGVPGVRLLSVTAGASLTPEQQARAFRPDKHTHLRLSFDDRGPDVFFRDTRKFGKVQLMPPDAPSARLDRLGRDALTVRGSMLFAALHARRASIKSLLLDQSLIAGVGNIYADEALFLAGVRPTRPGRRVTREECDRIARAIRRILRRSIATGGSSISDYVQPDGGAGAYQDERRVYGREGEPCPRCRTRIRRRVIGQRSAHYCPACQK